MAISISDALDLIYQKINSVGVVTIPMEESVGRVVASDYSASCNLPRFNNSAMDGYAVRLNDNNKSVHCIDTIYAGDKAENILRDGRCISIMTGAPIPNGCEAIVPKENTTKDNKLVHLPVDIKPNAHIRFEGEDIKKGEVFIQKSQKITPYTIALFASQGITHISVYRKVNVAIFSTGDELRPHYEKIESHLLYNSNAPMFISRALDLGCNTIHITTPCDTIKSIKKSIKSALNADIIITSGGVSVGDKDFTKEAFTQMGMDIFFEKVDIKPGKPTTFGKIKDTVIINLPGNPLAAMVNFEMFIKPTIARLQGDGNFYHGIIETKLDKTHNLKAGKYTVTLGKFNGINFTPLQAQAPGMVSPLIDADAMMVTKPTTTQINPTDNIKIIPITMRFSSDIKQEFFI
jgi:molybdopterin molybdotransferase